MQNNLKTLHPNYKLLLRPKPYTTIIKINVCYITYVGLYDHFHTVLSVISCYFALFMVIHVIKPTDFRLCKFALSPLLLRTAEFLQEKASFLIKMKKHHNFS